MSDTNDTLQQVASAETPTVTSQAEGAEGSGFQSSSEAKKWAGKFDSPDALEKAYIEAQKLIGRKSVDASALGLSQQSAPQPSQQQVVEAQHAVQNAGANSQLGQWFRQAVASGVSAEDAYAMIAQASGQQAAQLMVAKALEPVTAHQNQQTIRIVTQTLSEEYEDFADYAEDIGKWLEANPGIKAAIQSKDTDETVKKYHLENAYLKVSKTKARNAESAAKVAGAVDAKRTEQMKAATVTGGQGASTRNPAEGSGLADEWEKAAKAYEKGRRLFG